MHLMLLLTFLFLYAGVYAKTYDDYLKHPCKRDCNAKNKPMECVYFFTVEWYNTMNKECGNCPFNITDCYRRNCIAINGYKRAVMVVNRMLPGPSIEVCQGDTIIVKVKNMVRIVDGVTIHWHGLSQRLTPHMDGASMITQCPIHHNNYFQYKFLADDSGTYWWHSHSLSQRTDGVFGPLIIRTINANDPFSSLYDYDLSEHIITINDWFKEDFLVRSGPHVSNIEMKNADSIVINGRGAAVDFHNEDKINVYNTPRAIFNVEYGKRYRFRLISNAITSCPLTFTIENHNLTVITTDGQFIQPVTVAAIVLHSGERYDFILNATGTSKTYTIKVSGESMCKIQETAYLNYTETAPKTRSERTVDVDPMNMTKMVSSASAIDGIVLNPTNTAYLSSDMYVSVDGLKSINTEDNIAFINKIKQTPTKKYYFNIESTLNSHPEYPEETMIHQWQNISNVMPPIPVLFDFDLLPKNLLCNYFDKSQACPHNEDFCACIHLYELDLGDIVEIIVTDLYEHTTKMHQHSMFHMIHLHGYRFAVLKTDKLPMGTTLKDVQELDKNGKLNRNFELPPRKDTTAVPSHGYTIIRFIADNPGTWIFHCHTEFHTATGLSLLLKVGNATDLPIRKPDSWPECGSLKYNLKNNIQFSNELLIC